MLMQIRPAVTLFPSIRLTSHYNEPDYQMTAVQSKAPSLTLSWQLIACTVRAAKAVVPGVQMPDAKSESLPNSRAITSRRCPLN